MPAEKPELAESLEERVMRRGFNAVDVVVYYEPRDGRERVCAVSGRRDEDRKFQRMGLSREHSLHLPFGGSSADASNTTRGEADQHTLVSCSSTFSLRTSYGWDTRRK